MDILIVTSEHVEEGERRLDDKGWSFAKAFRALGHTTDTFFYRRKGRLRFLEKRRFAAFRRAGVNAALLAHATRIKPGLVLLLKAETISAATIAGIRSRTGAAVVNVFPDNPLLMGDFEAIAPCNSYFVKDSYVRDALWRAGLKNVLHLPQCTDPEVHRPIGLDAPDRAEYAARVSLIGSMYPYRLALMKNLADFEPVIWGKGWERCGEDPLLRNYRGRDVRGSAKAKAICGSDVNLNPHHPLNDIHGVNRRTYDIAACGGFQIAEMKRDLPEVLAPGEDIAVYDSLEALRDLVSYYLARPEERAAQAARARARVLGEHTYEHRAARILEILRA